MSEPMTYELTTDDDTLHPPPATADEWWTETFWFTFAVPESRLFGNLYLYFRPLHNAMGGGMSIFDDTGSEPWTIPFQSHQHHLPLPTGLDMRHAGLRSGIFVRQLEPNRSFAFGIHNAEVDADLRFDAFAEPLITVPKPRPPFTGAHHVDQPGHVTGTLELHGNRHEVDALLMRDRSWGRRADLRGVKAGYDYAFASQMDGFLGLSMDGGQDRVVMGFVLRDGQLSRAAGGRRHVVRDEDGMPKSIDIEVTDELGRNVSAHGEALTRYTNLIYPSMLVHQSLVRWEYDGHVAYAEDQDVWDPKQWRTFRRSGQFIPRV
jgi:hypothetical protein